MSNTTELKAEIKRLMVENLMLQYGPEKIADDQPLLGFRGRAPTRRGAGQELRSENSRPRSGAEDAAKREHHRRGVGSAHAEIASTEKPLELITLPG